MGETEKIRNALAAFNDALQNREHYAQYQIAAQESSRRISSVLDEFILKLIVSALKEKLRVYENLDAVCEASRPISSDEERVACIKELRRWGIDI